MVACCENKTRILPYGHIMTRVFKAFGIDLTLEDEVVDSSPYNTYNDMSMEQMKFEKDIDGSCVHSMDFGEKDGHQLVDDDKDTECDMTDVELNILPLHTNNSQTDVPPSVDEIGLTPNLSIYT